MKTDKKTNAQTDSKSIVSDDSFSMLSCNSNLGKSDPRVSLIRSAINDENVKNIAVIGPYGSGKSSVIRSYINSKKINKKAVYFSMDTLGNYKKPDSNNFRSIFYTELLKRNTSSIILNRYYNQLFNGKKRRILFGLFIILSLSISLVSHYFLKSIMGWASCLVALGIFLLLTLSYISLSLVSIKAQLKAFHGVDLFGEWKKEDYFEPENIQKHPGYVENVVIKQLSKMHIRYIVFEDLDRVDDVHYIDLIKELKSFNDLINQSKEFRCKYKRVIFFYAIKDDDFTDSELRTKYFDLIIPVVPYSTFSNAADSVLQNKYIKENVKESVVVDLSNYLLDQRQINAVTTQFNINKNVTYSKDLLSELFALTVFNVRFPSVFVVLFKKANCMNQLIKDYYTNPNLFDSFDIEKSAVNEVPSLKLLRVSINGLDSDEKKEFVLFIKTCLLHKYITFNYETLLHSKVENGLTSSDHLFLLKFRAGEYDRYYEVVNPNALINHVPNPSTLFSNKSGLNVFLVNYVFNFAKENRDLAKYIKTIEETLMDMTPDETSDYLNNIPYIPLRTDLYQILMMNFPNLIQLYYAACNIKEKGPKYDICLRLFNSFDSKKLDVNKKLPSIYCETINSKQFLDSCGQQLNANQIVALIKSHYFNPEDLSNFKIERNVLEALTTTNRYVKNYKNLCIVYSDFNDKPLTIINKNEELYNELISQKALFTSLLNECNLESTKDSLDDITLFLNKLAKSAQLDIINSKYFDQWKHKIKIPADSSNKYLSILKRGLIDFSNVSDLENAFRSAQDEFINLIINEPEYFATVKFNKEISWYLVKKLSQDCLDILKPSLMLTDSINYVNSIGIEKTKSILGFLSIEEKNKMLAYVMTNSPSTLVDAFIEKRINKNDLIDVKINTIFLDAVFDKNALSLLNVCLFKQNVDIARKYIADHPDYDFKGIFVGDSSEILKCDNLDIVIQYCISKQRDFDFVRRIITSFPKEEIIGFKDWYLFLQSFNLKKENKENKYLYFENNENNSVILNFLWDNGIVKNIKYQNNNSEIRCLI